MVLFCYNFLEAKKFCAEPIGGRASLAREPPVPSGTRPLLAIGSIYGLRPIVLVLEYINNPELTLGVVYFL